MRNYILIIGLALATSVMSTAASAEEIIVTNGAAPSVTVSVAGLDLNSSAGLAVAGARINAAASDLCLTNAVEPVSMRMVRAKCFQVAVSDGHRQLDLMTGADGGNELAGGGHLAKAAR